MIDIQYWNKLPMNVRMRLIKKYNLNSKGAQNSQNIDKLNAEIKEIVEKKKVPLIKKAQLHIIKDSETINNDEEGELDMSELTEYDVFSHDNNVTEVNKNNFSFTNVKLSIDFITLYFTSCDIITENEDAIILVSSLDQSNIFVTLEAGKLAKISFEEKIIDCVYLTNFKYNNLSFWIFFRKPTERVDEDAPE